MYQSFTRHMVRFEWVGRVILATFLSCGVAFSQVDEAREAIEAEEYVRAVNILSAAVAERPTPDTFLYLGIAHANMRSYDEAQATFREGAQRYPEDPRFHNELAGVFLAIQDVPAARNALRRALEVDPENSYASDLLAALDLSEGNVQAALKFWNASGRPVIENILHNYYLSFGSWLVPQALAFHPSEVLTYSDWKTTEARLFATDVFTNVALEVEPTPAPDLYNAVVRTSVRSNSWSGLLFNLLKGAPIKTSYLDVWNIAGSGVNWNSNYRWDANRRRAQGKLQVPLPLPGILNLDLGGTWRSERWDLSPTIADENKTRAQFHHRASNLQIGLRHIPHYRLEWGVGVKYSNRYGNGLLPELGTDSRNSGRFFAETSIRFADGDYQNRFRVQGFAARPSLLGDFRYSGGTAELNNRILVGQPRNFFDWTIKAGAARGVLPVEDYFALGIDENPEHLLRGHSTLAGGRYGRSPMGTDFVLLNTDYEHRLVTVPLFNTMNIPYIIVKAEVFFDAAKTWDRHNIFRENKLWLDTGASLKFETPTMAVNLGFGRSLRDGTGVLFGYIERRLW